jgi:hypothetical protein
VQAHCDGSMKDFQVGDMVDIYHQEYSFSPSLAYHWVDKPGIIIEIVGYKTTVLIDGELDGWDISDLRKMHQHKRIETGIEELDKLKVYNGNC